MARAAGRQVSQGAEVGLRTEAGKLLVNLLLLLG